MFPLMATFFHAEREIKSYVHVERTKIFELNLQATKLMQEKS